MDMREQASASEDRPPSGSGGPVAIMVARARAAHGQIARLGQNEADLLAAAAGWALLEPGRNRALAERAVADTGLGNVADKIAKNHRKTLGLLADLKDVKSVGILAEDKTRGIIEIARPVGVIAAITPSTNPAATPANKIINALKARNSIILAPSPKGWSTGDLLVQFVHQQLDRLGAPRDLVQCLPAPITRAMTDALMREVDLIVATGSQTNIRAAQASGTPTFGVGTGNVASIVDRSADVAQAAALIAKSKTFDYATSCSSENSLVIDTAIYPAMVRALAAEGGVLLTEQEKERLAGLAFGAHGPSPAVIGQSAGVIADRAGLTRPGLALSRFLMVEEYGIGQAFPFSREKLSPILTLYRAADFVEACRLVETLYRQQGAGHSVGLHSSDENQPISLAENLPVARVIVNQAHAMAVGGNFDNGLPFSLSMGCGTWGGNVFSDNLQLRHYLNISRVSRRIGERAPQLDTLLGAYFDRVGR
jgi:sulfoacetaldehyde dehydrogenase